MKNQKKQVSAVKKMRQEAFWWQIDEEKPLHEELRQTVKSINMRQYYKYEENLRHMRLYGNFDILGVRVNNYTAPTTLNRVSINIVQMIVDTLVSRIGKNRPKPTFLTENGDWEARTRAQKLDKYMYGRFYKADVYKQGKESFRDACVWGTGFLKVYAKNKDVIVERTMPDEIKVDDRECIYGTPRNMYQIKYVSRDVLIALYPEMEESIERATYGDVDMGQTYTSVKENDMMVQVIEAWHLPSGEETGDGKHAIALSTCTLINEEYTRETFPFVQLRYPNKLMGFWGCGIAERLTGVQIELNKTLRRIQQSLNLVSVPRVLYNYASNIVKQHFDNEIGSMIGFTGQPPQFIAPQGVNPELWTHVNFLFQKAFEIVGTSQLSASSQKPAGLNSKVAMREYNDIETERFADIAQDYEDFYMRLCSKIIECEQEIAKVNKGHFVLASDKGSVEKLKWSDVNLSEDSYIMQPYPTSLLPHSPAGKRDTVIEMISAGLFDKDEGLSLLEYPDIEKISRVKNAAKDDILRTIDTMVIKGEYLPPEPIQKLEMAIPMVQSSILYYKNEGCPDEKIDLLRRWLADAMAMLDDAKNKIMQQQAASAAQYQQVNIPTKENLTVQQQGFGQAQPSQPQQTGV